MVADQAKLWSLVGIAVALTSVTARFYPSSFMSNYGIVTNDAMLLCALVDTFIVYFLQFHYHRNYY